MITINHRWTGAVLWSGEAATMAQAVRRTLEAGVNLTGADLTRADLRGADLRGADLRGADLRGADLRGADLRGAVLRDAVLRDAVLTRAVLTGADLTDADLTDVPVIPQIDSAILAACSADGHHLDMRSWHTCETTHCRAGWAIVLAGPEGAALEQTLGTGTAAALIYARSRPGQRVPDWYASTEDAWADLRASAEASS